VKHDHFSEGAWSGVLDQMFAELHRGESRTVAYWAQQMAFSPVLFHALALRLRADEVPEEDQKLLREVVALALAGLGALPDEGGSDPSALQFLARRQAAALSWDRRRHLRRLAAKLGLKLDEQNPGFVPSSMCRPYPLLGWKAPETMRDRVPRG